MILGLIPSRLNSKRLKEKPLLKIDGLPIIVHTFKRAELSKKLDDVIVCTDHQKIVDVVKSYGGKVVLTSKKHENGTERIYEVAKKKKAELIIDIQGDEPLVNPSYIDKVVDSPPGIIRALVLYKSSLFLTNKLETPILFKIL